MVLLSTVASLLDQLQCTKVESIQVNGIQIRGNNVFCWTCENRSEFCSATWLASLIGKLGTLIDAKIISFQVYEPGIVDLGSILKGANQIGSTWEGSIPFEKRRELVLLFEEQGNYGSWRFAMSSTDKSGNFENYSTADAFLEVDLDIGAYGFVRTNPGAS